MKCEKIHENGYVNMIDVLLPEGCDISFEHWGYKEADLKIKISKKENKMRTKEEVLDRHLTVIPYWAGTWKQDTLAAMQEYADEYHKEKKEQEVKSWKEFVANLSEPKKDRYLVLINYKHPGIGEQITVLREVFASNEGDAQMIAQNELRYKVDLDALRPIEIISVSAIKL